MPARFVEKRIISVVEELNPTEREQLRVAGKFYDGSDLPAESRLAGGVDEDDGSLFDTELWKVVDGGRHLYDAWFYMTDSGTFFRAGTTEDVAMVIQSGLECEDPALRTELGAAMVEAKLLPQSDNSYAEFAAALEAQGGSAAGGGSKKPSKQAPAKKPAAKQAVAAKKASKPAAKKPAAKKAAAAKKPAASKPAAKKPAAKKPAAKKAAAAKKPAAKKKPVAKKRR